MNTWSRGEQRAPHKPLYFLYCLGQLQAGKPRLESFENVRVKLQQALHLFGPSRKAHHPEYPFWHLAHGKESICEIRSTAEIALRPGSSNPSANELKKKMAAGGLKQKYHEALANLAFSSIAAHRILDAHFPSILHADLLEFFEIQLDEPHAADWAPTWEFNARVREAYNGICAITGLGTEFQGITPGLQTVYIWWPQAGGNNHASNGIFLNSLHAKLFAMGLVTISESYVLESSPELKTRGPAGEGMKGKRLLLPTQESQWPSQKALAWHRSQVFKS